MFWSIFVLLLLAGGYYTFLVVTGTDNFKGINIQLNDVYKDNDEMTLAVVEELKKQGKKCEITKLSKSFSEVIVDDKKYYVSARTTNIGHAPVQTVILKPVK